MGENIESSWDSMCMRWNSGASFSGATWESTLTLMIDVQNAGGALLAVTYGPGPDGAVADERYGHASWLLAWPMIMLAKEPFLFPRPLRWAKEDQFISPLMGLFVGAVVWSLPRPWMRWGAAALAVGTALWLELGDFRIHVSGLMP